MALTLHRSPHRTAPPALSLTQLAPHGSSCPQTAHPVRWVLSLRRESLCSARHRLHAAQRCPHVLTRRCRESIKLVQEPLLTAASGRERRFGLPFLAVAGDQRLRRHARVEVGIRERCTIRHLFQVKLPVSQCLNPLTLTTPPDLHSTATNASSPMLVSPYCFFCR